MAQRLLETVRRDCVRRVGDDRVERTPEAAIEVVSAQPAVEEVVPGSGEKEIVTTVSLEEVSAVAGVERLPAVPR